MGKVRDLRELSIYIRNTKSALVRGHAEAMLIVTGDAEAYAKRIATQKFTGRNGRKLSGRLLNAIYSGFTPFSAGQSLPVGFVGTRGIPYGRIHEYGGRIVPKNAKHLWVKQWGGDANKFRRMTPREFIAAKQKEPSRFRIFRSKAGNLIAAFQLIKNKASQKARITPLFILKNQVTIPERSYIREGIALALKKYPQIARQKIAKSLLGIK